MSTKTFQPGNILDFTAPTGGVASGTPVLIGSVLVIPQTTAAVGVAFAGSVVGVHSVPKATGVAWTEGMTLYWDADNANLSTVRLGRAVAIAAATATSGATTGYARLVPSARPADATLIVADDDSATSNGTDVYVVAGGGDGPYLVSVNAGNANSLIGLSSSDYIPVVDSDDAATLGVALYFDEDADEDSKLQIVSPTGGDVYLRTAHGRLIRVKHNASAASAGVATHFDDNGSPASERLLFVSPTNADGSATARGGI